MGLTPREHLPRFVAAITAGDWDAVRDLLGPDIRVVDRRPIGWGETVGREASMATFEAWTKLSPDFRLSAQLIAAGPNANVGRYLYHGVAEHGVKWEMEMIIFVVVENGQSTFCEIFSGDDAESALARLKEIDAQTE